MRKGKKTPTVFFNASVIIAGFISKAIDNSENESFLIDIKNDVAKLCSKFPLYPELKS